MKSIKHCIMVAALCCMMPAFAQKNFGEAKYTSMCSYYGEQVTGTITAYDADAATQSMVTNIMSVIGLKPNFELRVANVPNAAAVLIKGKRYILYNPKFMEEITGATGTNWAAISILAHEIGHHLNGHTLDNVGSRPKTELEADEFSGFVLRKMGATLAEAQAVMGIIASLKGSHTHPAKDDRLAFIATGWNNADPQATAAVQPKTETKTTPAAATVANTKAPVKTAAPQKAVVQAAKPKATTKKTTATTPKPAVAAQAKPKPKPAVASSQTSKAKQIATTVNSDKVLSDVYLTASPQSKYYVTAKGNLVQVENDKVYLVAGMYKSDKQGYSVMFADADAHKLYVGKGGTIVNESGTRVGYVKAR
jgi:outer membrane biosynthesis protein TonB